MGYLQSKLFCDHCVNQLVRPTRIPPRQSGAAKAVYSSTPPGGASAKGKRVAGYVLQSAAAAGPSPWVYRGVALSPYTAPLCEG
eukprot:scaffold73540_cov56-Phaeocystis_antarctica.AAC.1